MNQPPRPPAPQRSIVISLRTGQLANRLVLFANFVAFAEEYGWQIINPAFHTYAELFETTGRDVYCRYPIPRKRSLLNYLPGVPFAIHQSRAFYKAAYHASRFNQRHAPFGKKIVTIEDFRGSGGILLNNAELHERIDHAKLVFAHVWRFRVPDILRRHAPKVRSFFRPISEIGSASFGPIKRLRCRADVVVGVHVRQGDYRNWCGGKYFYPVDRYCEWMQEIAGQFPDRRVGFFVCSDEPRTPAEFANMTVEIGAGPALGNMMALAQCDFIMGTMSTFVQWASFYGNVPMRHMYGVADRPMVRDFRVSFFEEIP